MVMAVSKVTPRFLMVEDGVIVAGPICMVLTLSAIFLLAKPIL